MIPSRFSASCALSCLAVLSCASPAPQPEPNQEPRRSEATTEIISASALRNEVVVYSRPGYIVEPRDGRLWVFLEGSSEYEQFKTVGEPAKTVTRIRTGPGGISLRSSDRDTLIGYENSTLRHHARVIDGRLWIFDNEKEDFRELLVNGPPGVCVSFVGRGPERMTLCAVERETLHDWLYAAPGFHTKVVDDRLWILEEGSAELAEFLENGELAKSVTLIKAGPGGITMRGPSRETLRSYMAAKSL